MDPMGGSTLEHLGSSVQSSADHGEGAEGKAGKGGFRTSCELLVTTMEMLRSC